MVDNKKPFLFWEPFVRDGGIIILSPYITKYRGGVSPRDAVAMAKTFGILRRWGHRAEIDVNITDGLAPADHSKNIILIGSASGNPVVQKTLDRLREKHAQLSFSLETNYWRDSARKAAGHQRTNLIPNYIIDEDLGWGAPFVEVDIGIVARAPSPYHPDKTVVFVAGVHGYGTLGAADVYCDEHHQREIETHLEYAAADSRLGNDHYDIVEVILQAKVGHDLQAPNRPIRPLTDTKIQFVRVNRDLNLQSPKDVDIWTGAIPRPRVRHRPNHFTISFDDLEKGHDRSLIKLKGHVSSTFFRNVSFTESECRSLAKRVDSAIRDGGSTSEIAKVGEELAEKLFPALASASVDSPDELYCSFSGPIDYLRIPFEATRIKNNSAYLALTHPLVRSINDLHCNRRPLNAEVLEELRQKQDKLRILLVAANPTGNLPEAEAEIRKVEEKLYLDGATLGRLACKDLPSDHLSAASAHG